MEDKVIDEEAIPEKGVTVTTVVAEELTETVIRKAGVAAGDEEQFDAGIAVIQNPRAAGPPVLQHDLAVRDVHAGVYGDFSEDSGPTASV